jgi:hypothetical protein
MLNRLSTRKKIITNIFCHKISQQVESQRGISHDQSMGPCFIPIEGIGKQSINSVITNKAVVIERYFFGVNLN